MTVPGGVVRGSENARGPWHAGVNATREAAIQFLRDSNGPATGMETRFMRALNDADGDAAVEA